MRFLPGACALRTRLVTFFFSPFDIRPQTGMVCGASLRAVLVIARSTGLEVMKILYK